MQEWSAFNKWVSLIAYLFTCIESYLLTLQMIYKQVHSGDFYFGVKDWA